MNTKEEIIAFKPTKEFFIGIDSDGTAFDSMNIKHIKSMGPAAMEIWDFGEKKEEFEKTWNKINLYSKDRGTNRFLGLLAALEQVPPITSVSSVVKNNSSASSAREIILTPFREYVEKNEVYSNATLQEWMEKNPSPVLDDVMRWSKRSDELFEKYTEGLLPFKNIESCLAQMAKKADIMVVSAASGKGLDKDWSFSGLTRHTTMIAGQEAGSKKTQLQMGADGKYPPEKILMVGDAPGDLEAARAINALFFPIMPGNEEESWLRLRDDALFRFFSGTFKGKYEDFLIDDFLAFLC